MVRGGEDVAGEEEVVGEEALVTKAVAGARSELARDSAKATALTSKRAIANTAMTAPSRIYPRRASGSMNVPLRPENGRRSSGAKSETFVIPLYP